MLQSALAGDSRSRRHCDFEGEAPGGLDSVRRRFHQVRPGSERVAGPGSAHADYIVVPVRSVDEVHVGGCVRRAQTDSHARGLEQGEAIVLRVSARPISGVASLRPHACARHRLRTGKCSHTLRAHAQGRCIDFEREAPGGSDAIRRRFYRVLAGLERAHYLRVVALTSIVVAGDYRAVRPRAPHQVQVGVYAG